MEWRRRFSPGFNQMIGFSLPELLRRYSYILLYKENKMQFIILSLIGLIVIDIAALRWGFDSRDNINSAEWKLRKCSFLG